MPLALLVVGLVLVIAAARGTYPQLFSLVQKDFTGQDNFLYWIAAFGIIGAIGFVPKLKPFSVALLALVIVAIFLKKGTGFFDQLASTLKSTAQSTAQPQA